MWSVGKVLKMPSGCTIIRKVTSRNLILVLVFPVCGEIYIGSTELKLHLYTHSGVKPFPCKICNNEFRTPNNLRTHEASRMIERKFSYNLCDKTFKQKQTLKKHEILYLEFFKPYNCGTCGMFLEKRES